MIILFLLIVICTKKNKSVRWGIVLFLTGIILIGCGSEKTGDGYEYQTGVHKIVIRQSGDTGAFDVNVSIGGGRQGWSRQIIQ
ncbi:beta-barrel fold lipoprotein [Bacteroides fragilis]